MPNTPSNDRGSGGTRPVGKSKGTSASKDASTLFDGGGNIDIDALFRAYEDQSDDESPVEVTFELQRNHNKRLDAYLAGRIPFLSRTSLQRLIAEEVVWVNGRTPKSSTRLKSGDKVRVILPPPPSTEIPPEELPLQIVYEDKDLIVLNKQDDIIVHPARGNRSGTVINALSWHFKNVSDGTLSTVGEEFARPGVVHRLDRHTTGVMVAAKTDTAHWRLSKQFEERRTHKRYLALVHGEVEPLTDVIDVPLGKHPTKRGAYAVRWDDQGKESVTIFRVREQYEGYTLVELELKTGRTHQIRLHLRHLGYPIVGDDMYGGKHLKVSHIVPPGIPSDFDRTTTVISRQALHASLLEFDHPITGQVSTFTAPLHDDMQQLVALLRAHRFKSKPTVPGAILDLDQIIASS
ncbi:MAG: RluA family pseudouridine synthase [Phycisphaerales bacterium]|jgi:23S rRNA pseudouridine1911/1915/1917 synthase|nr:RluA family pseudouridine synthase [Phycisphaerales bacterium]